MEKNDKKMTGVLYGGVQKFWVRRCIIITTEFVCKTRYIVILFFALLDNTWIMKNLLTEFPTGAFLFTLATSPLLGYEQPIETHDCP